VNRPRLSRAQRAAALLIVLVLAGCTGKGVSYDKEVDDLGAHIVADLKTEAEVDDASYRYDHGVDFGQRLRVRAILKQDSVSPAVIQRVIDKAVKDFWLSPANVGHLMVALYSTANPPAGDDDNANKDRAIGSEDIEDSVAFDRPEMERKYGPRPTR
jgi:hypothetical protein